MFGILAGGRPCGNFEQIDPVRWGHVLKNASKTHFMAVFILPGFTLPPNTAGSVYVQLPGQEFKLMGFLSEEKQSAIFKFNPEQVATSVANDVDEMMDESAAATEFDVFIGISLEPLEQAQANLAQLRQAQATAPRALAAPQGTQATVAAPTDAGDIAALGNKIVENAYNYMSGFTDTDGKVPIKAFNTWWDKFTSRLKTDPKFLFKS